MHIDPNKLHSALAALAGVLVPFIVEELQGNHGNATAQAGGLAPNTAPVGQNNALMGMGGNAAAQPAATGGDMFGATTPPAQTAPTVTADDIQKLITPMVQNEKVKAALVTQMNEMGINNLPDARPEQLAELHTRFKEVERQAIAAGLIGGGTAAATPSLI